MANISSPKGSNRFDDVALGLMELPIAEGDGLERA